MRLIHLDAPVSRRNIFKQLASSVSVHLRIHTIKMSGKIGFHVRDSSRSCGILKNDSSSSRTVSQNSQNSQNSDYSFPSITTVSTVSLANTPSDVTDISNDNFATKRGVSFSTNHNSHNDISDISAEILTSNNTESIANTHSDISTDNLSRSSISDKTFSSSGASFKSRPESFKSRPVSASTESEIIDLSLPRPMAQVDSTAMRLIGPTSGKGPGRSLDSFKCPCCLRLLEAPRLLSCLHSVCTPCLTKVESLLRSYEKKRGKKSVHWSSQPLGKFLCPACNSLELIPRQGISLIPVNIPAVHSMDRARNNQQYQHNSSQAQVCGTRAEVCGVRGETCATRGELCATRGETCATNGEFCTLHNEVVFVYCFTCNVTLCHRCVEGGHKGHTLDQVDKVSKGFSEALENAVKEISERMKVIENGIGKIKAAREAGRKEKREVRKTVQTYYEGYVRDVREHTEKLEAKIQEHQNKNFNMLLREELQLEQYKDDLNLLCDQIDLILKSKSNLELAKFIIPVAKRLKVISKNIMNTGESITERLEFLPRSMSDTDIPGILTSFTISQANSHLILDRPIYEKVLCAVQLVLMDQHGMRLEVYRNLDVNAVMTVFQKEENVCKAVDVSFERQMDRSTWQLTFTPPFHGIASLAVTIDGVHIKNSPYVINVRKLFLDTSFLSRSNSKRSTVIKIDV